MEKWADFGISRVKYDDRHEAISEVEIQPDLGERFGYPQRASRQNVVTAIGQGKTFVTIIKSPDDKSITRGEEVRTVTVRGQKYLRTDNNGTPADNLGSLPEYS